MRTFYNSIRTPSNEHTFIAINTIIPSGQRVGRRIDLDTGVRDNVTETQHMMKGIIIERSVGDGIISDKTTKMYTVLFDLKNFRTNPDGVIPEPSDDFMFEGVRWEAKEITYSPMDESLCELVLISTERVQ